MVAISPDPNKLVTVFGGSGFVGRHVVRALARRGWRVRVAVRRPDLAHHLQPLGIVGQVHAVQANLRYPESLSAALEGATACINLVAILAESGRQTFQAVHVDGAAAIAAACRAAGIERLVHVSALGADPESPAAYARTKAAGEAAMHAAVPATVILRPSVIFGPEDQFLNRFAAMARLSPVLPLIGGGETLFQPVFVGDVAEAVAKAVEGEARAGTIYELGGPEVKSFRAVLEQILAITGRRRLLLPVPWPVARLKAAFLEMLPGKLLTLDQVALLRSDNVVSNTARDEGRTLAGLGIQPETMGVIAPTYLWRFRRAGQFERATGGA
jgi:NADH dehydrogenase